VAFGPNWAGHVVATIEGIALGFLAAVVFGTAGAVVIVSSDTLRRAITPLLVTIQIVPKIAFAPLILVWFGIGLTSRATIAFLVAFFPVLVNTAVRPHPDRARPARPGPLHQGPARVGLLPHPLPQLVALLLRRAAGRLDASRHRRSHRGVRGSDVGLGYLIVIANNQIDTALGLAAIFLISLIGLLLYGAVVLTERLCTPWAGGEGGLETSL